MAAFLSRELALVPEQTVLLIVDVQQYSCNRQGGMFRGMNPVAMAAFDYYFERLDQMVLPNIARLQAACRATGIEVMFTVIESLTQDGRDIGLDYKISGFNIPKGSADAKIPDAVQPLGDEMTIPKTSSSVFNSTRIDYILRNLGCRQLVICGVLSDQCVESAVRDACDLNYLVTLVPDACATYTEERQLASLNTITGYCRQRESDALIQEINSKPETIG